MVSTPKKDIKVKLSVDVVLLDQWSRRNLILFSTCERAVNYNIINITTNCNDKLLFRRFCFEVIIIIEVSDKWDGIQ